MAVFNHSEFDNHEQVVFCSDAETGLKAIIAVHSTALGPAVGGGQQEADHQAEDQRQDQAQQSREDGAGG